MVLRVGILVGNASFLAAFVLELSGELEGWECYFSTGCSF